MGVKLVLLYLTAIVICVADPDPGSGAFLTPGSSVFLSPGSCIRDGKKSGEARLRIVIKCCM